MVAQHGITITWMGHATTKIETADGKVILIDAWLEHNPATPDDLKNISRVDLMLISHGHFDHTGDAVAIAERTQPQIIAVLEVCSWLESKGIKNCQSMNIGGTQQWNGIDITAVAAVHSSSMQEGDETIPGGVAAGYILRFPDGFAVYHAGDTAVFGDMQLIGRLYQPDIALLPIGDHFTMGPREAAEAIRLLGVKCVIPIHYGTFPVLTGTPDMLRDATSDVAGLQLLPLKPGESVRQSELK